MYPSEIVKSYKREESGLVNLRSCQKSEISV